MKTRALTNLKLINTRPGYSLALVLILTAVAAVVAASALATLKKESTRTVDEYFQLAARQAANSGLELALAEIKKQMPAESVPSNQSREFSAEYGSQYFPSAKGRPISCLVKAWISADQIYIQAQATVTESKPGGLDHIRARKTIKRLVRVSFIPKTTWQISD